MLGHLENQEDDGSVFQGKRSRRSVYKPDPAEQQQNIDFLEKFFPERHRKRYMIPNEFPMVISRTDTGKLAEEKFFNILKQIDEPMVVIYSFKCSVARTMEVDFFVCHKTRGIMLFEVKATSKVNRGFKEGQAQAHKNTINAKMILEHHLELKEKDVRYTAVLPNCHHHNAPRTEGVYFEDLESKESFQAWLDKFRPTNGRELTDDQYDCCFGFFVNRVDPIRYADSINFIHDGLQELTPAQAKVLDGLPEEFYIAGPAGTGKTEIMIYKAGGEKLAEQMKLIVVFHKGLAEYLKWRMRNVKKLTIKTFKGLLLECTQHDFRDTVKNRLSNAQLVNKAIQVLSEPSDDDCPQRSLYDSIFVDEAQDMEGNWEVLIECLHNPGPEHYRLIFYDDNQMVSYSNPPKPHRSQVYHLTEVIRNTRNIFKRSLLFCKTERECNVLHKYDGPEVIWYDNFTDGDLEYYTDNVLQVIGSHVKDISDNLIHVAPMDICVLVENEERAFQLRGRMVQEEFIVAPFTVEEMVYNLKHEHWWHTGKVEPGKQCGVTVDSVSRYTGLGSKAVILVLNHNRINAKLVEKVYTGITRSSCKLIVIKSRQGHKYLERIIARGITTTSEAEPMEIED